MTSKSQTGDPYSGLEDLPDIFGHLPTLRYPNIEGQRMALQAEGEYEFPWISSVGLIKSVSFV